MHRALQGLTSTETEDNQNKTRPPLRPLLLTAKQPEYPKDHMKLRTLLSLIFVSDRKRREGR
jgi:hypothetical protein